MQSRRSQNLHIVSESGFKWFNIIYEYIFGSVTSLWTAMSVCRSVCPKKIFPIFLHIRTLSKYRLRLVFLKKPSPQIRNNFDRQWEGGGGGGGGGGGVDKNFN